jgi:hypothetical protein
MFQGLDHTGIYSYFSECHHLSVNASIRNNASQAQDRPGSAEAAGQQETATQGLRYMLQEKGI